MSWASQGSSLGPGSDVLEDSGQVTFPLRLRAHGCHCKMRGYLRDQ